MTLDNLCYSCRFETKFQARENGSMGICKSDCSGTRYFRQCHFYLAHHCFGFHLIASLSNQLLLFNCFLKAFFRFVLKVHYFATKTGSCFDYSLKYSGLLLFVNAFLDARQLLKVSTMPTIGGKLISIQFSFYFIILFLSFNF